MYGPGSHSNPALNLDVPDWIHTKKQRAAKHASNIWNFLGSGPNEDLTMNWMYFITKLLASISTLFLIVQIFAISGSVLFWDSGELAVFVTNTFYTSNDNEQNVSWPIVTSPAWNGFARGALVGSPNSYTNLYNDHNYECMWVSQQGWSLCNGSAASVASYQQCLQNNYQAGITMCAAAGSLTYSWPTVNIYANCINNNMSGGSRWNLNAFKTCIHNDLWPLYEIPQDVDTPYFLGAYSWPLLTLTGAYLMAVFALYTFYPVDYEDATTIEQGKPKKSFVRLGIMWTVLPIVFALVWLFFMLLQAFRAGSTWPQSNSNLYPSTQQTNVIVVVSSAAVVFYFLLELSEFQDRRTFEKQKEKAAEKQAGAESVQVHPHGHREKGEDEAREVPYGYASTNFGLPTPATMTSARPGVSAKVFSFPKGGGMGYYFPNPNKNTSVNSLDDAKLMYTPVLLNTWADAYLLHPMFFVGAIGAGLQVFTADVFNIFWCLMFNRIAHLGVSRAVYHCYISERTAGGDSEAARESIATTKVLGLAMHFAASVALVVVAYILFDSTRFFSEIQVITSLFALSYMVPEAIRLVGHLFLAFTSHEYARANNIIVLLGMQFIWAWDLIIMIIYLWLIFWGSNSNRGTKPFLLNNYNSINSMMQFTASCCPGAAAGVCC